MRDVVPGGTMRNHAYLGPTVDWGELSTPEQLVLADAQTSGGLLIATLDPERMARELGSRRVAWAEIGLAVGDGPGTIAVTGRLAQGV
jgi:selenophosphate synthase